MKKTFLTTLMALLLCVCMVFGFAGCGASQEDIDNAVSEATAPLNEQIAQLERENAELNDRVTTLENCLADKHDWSYPANDIDTHTATCKHCDEEVVETHNYDGATRLCPCGSILYVKSTINGNTQILTIYEGATNEIILHKLSTTSSTFVVKGNLTDEQYQAVVNDGPANAAVFFVNRESNNYIASNGSTYTCVIGSESDDKYVLIVNELKSYAWTGNMGGGQYDVYLNQLTTQTPGARAILYDEAAWSKYQEMFVANCPTPDENKTAVCLLLGNTGWTLYYPSTAEWGIFRTWSGSRTPTHYWYPVFDVPLS